MVIHSNVEAGAEVAEGYTVNLVVSLGKPYSEKPMTINESIIPVGVDEGNLKVYIYQDDQQQLLYDQQVSRSEFPLTINVSGRGTVIVEVYFNDIKQFSNAVVFNN